MSHATGKHDLNHTFRTAFFTLVKLLVGTSLFHSQEIAQREPQCTQNANSQEIPTPRFTEMSRIIDPSDNIVRVGVHASFLCREVKMRLVDSEEAGRFGAGNPGEQRIALTY